jgi:hypothetical protein
MPGLVNDGWDAKNVPDHVKRTVEGLAVVVQQQYNTTLLTMASQAGTLSAGDGVLGYLNGWNHKRFGGQYCLLYTWQTRRDGLGFFLCVKGIGRKNGTGQNYAELH